MGSFSDIRPVNITHEGFGRHHNGQYFQTKDLDMEYGMAKYCIFNAQLYRNVSDVGAGEAAAVPVPHTCSGSQSKSLRLAISAIFGSD